MSRAVETMRAADRDGGRLMNTFVHRTQLRLLLLGFLVGRAPRVRRLRLVLKI
jgi:hypothetical protein